MIVSDACPACGSTRFKKNGRTHNGKQQHQCKAYPRQFVQCAAHYHISAETRGLIERLLRARISLRGICRVVGVGLKWLLGFIVHCFEALPDHLHVQLITCTQDVMIQRLEVKADEMASFVKKKANKQWIWLAMDTKSRQVIAFHVGGRSRTSVKRLWAKIPQRCYRRTRAFRCCQKPARTRRLEAVRRCGEAWTWCVTTCCTGQSQREMVYKGVFSKILSNNINSLQSPYAPETGVFTQSGAA